LTNRALNPYFTFPLSNSNLQKLTIDKWKTLTGTHHFEDTDGFEVNSTAPGAVAVTYLTLEETINEAKRKVKILKGDFLRAFVNEFNTLINRTNA